METLNFRPEPFGGIAAEHGCGCAACKHGELDDEFEYETARAVCSDLPADVKCIKNHPKADRQKCKPGHVDPCPAIPELWQSNKIGGVPFYYNPEVTQVPGTGGKRFQVVRAGKKTYEVRLVPRAWQAALKWINLMSGMGMPLEAVLTAGAGPYCRCVKRPRSCGKHPETCTGTTASNHGAGDAIDVTGVVWKAPSSVGSSLRATVMHSWQDSAEQAPLLVRVNAALRLAFPKVIDYADSFHRDHFHVDTNQGRHVKLFEHTERPFVAGCLRRLGYSSSKSTDNAELLRGLAAFAAQLGITAPTSTRDLEPWRPIVHRMYGCVAVGNPSACRRP